VQLNLFSNKKNDRFPACYIIIIIIIITDFEYFYDARMGVLILLYTEHFHLFCRW